MFERRSLKWPIALAVGMIIILISLTVGWILLNVSGLWYGSSSSGFYWTLLSLGSALFVLMVVGVVLYLVIAIQQINLNRRQSNFIDSVTHELKSPIASLKLYLQTLGRRNIAEEQRHAFYESMLTDVERLDKLINQLLETARLSHHETAREEEETIRLDLLLGELIAEICDRYELTDENVDAQLEPMTVLSRTGELRIVFRNLLDNAAKYASDPPKIEIRLGPSSRKDWLKVSITDNGPGIPRDMRRQIYGRFVRVGNELERTKPGTGLGLFLVRSVLKKMRGRITLADLPKHSGTRFDVQLPKASRWNPSETETLDTSERSPLSSTGKSRGMNE
ncbi:MAG: HAMP domain-containing sensor histidine kinase [Pirellulales bacterium]